MNQQPDDRTWEEEHIHNLNMEIEKLTLREGRILSAIKECFPFPGCTDGNQIVSDENYNKLVAEINKGE